MTKKLETFNRSDLEDQLSIEFPQLDKKKISQAVDTIIDTIIEAVALDNKVEIRGFGTYKVKKRKARLARNPKSSETIEVPEKKAIKWKMSKTFFKRLNKNFTDKIISDTY